MLPVHPSFSPLPLASTGLFSVFESASVWKVHSLCHILDSTYEWYHVAFVFLFLTNFTSMIIFSCIRVAANDIILFLLKAEWCSIYVCVCVSVCVCVCECVCERESVCVCVCVL